MGFRWRRSVESATDIAVIIVPSEEIDLPVAVQWKGHFRKCRPVAAFARGVNAGSPKDVAHFVGTFENA